ncbi:hypothetical protein VIGAN_04205100, partial [Vigna angularis var. angularis]
SDSHPYLLPHLHCACVSACTSFSVSRCFSHSREASPSNHTSSSLSCNSHSSSHIHLFSSHFYLISAISALETPSSPMSSSIYGLR